MNIQTDSPAPAKELNTPQTIIEGGDFILESAVRQVLGLDEKESIKNKDKIQTILNWARTQTKDHSPENIKWAIRDMEVRLGSSFAEPKINRVARYAYLAMEKNKIDGELKSFEATV